MLIQTVDFASHNVQIIIIVFQPKELAFHLAKLKDSLHTTLLVLSFALLDSMQIPMVFVSQLVLQVHMERILQRNVYQLA